MKQCDNGHFYDEARFESCPYCKENTGIGKTMAAADIGKTVAAFPDNPAAAAATAFDSGKTVAVMKKKIGIDPAVGFLICIEGPHRGTDFRLVSGRNLYRTGLPRWMFPCRMMIPYPVKVMHWSLTM